MMVCSNEQLTRKEAQREAKHIRKMERFTRVHHYHCPECQAWHVGHH